MDDFLADRGYKRKPMPRYVASFVITAVIFLGAGFVWVIGSLAYLASPVLVPFLTLFSLVWLSVYVSGWNPWEEKEVHDE
jgi:hypothetical protein